MSAHTQGGCRRCEIERVQDVPEHTCEAKPIRSEKELVIEGYRQIERQYHALLTEVYGNGRLVDGNWVSDNGSVAAYAKPAPTALGGPLRVVSVQPEWCLRLPVQQQSVLFLAGRGPDGKEKNHPCKRVQVAYRGSVFVAAKYGRCLEWGERADKFMSLDEFANNELWSGIVRNFFNHHDSLPHHYLNHLMHGVQILGYKHPDVRFRERWCQFYVDMAENEHLKPESEAEMDARLSDWGRSFWGVEPGPERFPGVRDTPARAAYSRLLGPPDRREVCRKCKVPFIGSLDKLCIPENSLHSWATE